MYRAAAPHRDPQAAFFVKRHAIWCPLLVGEIQEHLTVLKGAAVAIELIKIENEGWARDVDVQEPSEPAFDEPA